MVYSYQQSRIIITVNVNNSITKANNHNEYRNPLYNNEGESVVYNNTNDTIHNTLLYNPYDNNGGCLVEDNSANKDCRIFNSNSNIGDSVICDNNNNNSFSHIPATDDIDCGFEPSNNFRSEWNYTIL